MVCSARRSQSRQYGAALSWHRSDAGTYVPVRLANPELSKAAASLPLNLASPINAGAIAMLLSLIVVPLVSACTKVKDTDHVENVFTCYAPAAEKKD